MGAIPPELLDILQKGGAAIAPLLFWLYLSERSERKDLQAQLATLTERTITVMTELKGMLSGSRNRNAR